MYYPSFIFNHRRSSIQKKNAVNTWPMKCPVKCPMKSSDFIHEKCALGVPFLPLSTIETKISYCGLKIPHQIFHYCLIYIYANIRWYSFIIVKVRQHYHVSQIPMDQDTIFAMKITSWKPQAEAYLQDPQRCFSCLVSTMKYPWDNLLVTSSPRLLAKLSLKHPMAHGPRWKPMGKIPCNWVLILLKPQNYR